MAKRKQVRWALGALMVSVLALIAIMQAEQANAAPNTDAVVSGACGETEFDAALTAVQLSPGGTITFSCPIPTTITFTFGKSISKNVVINGGTLGNITLSGGNNSYLFQVNFGGQLTVQNIALANASSNSQGAIQSFGPLTLSNCTMTNNRANGTNGGAIYASGALTMTGCTLSNNRASYGGAIYVEGGASASINSSTIYSNAADIYGGGLYNAFGGVSTLTNVTLSSNRTITDGTTTAPRGAGVLNAGTLTMTGGSVISNTSPVALGGGGGFYNGDCTNPASLVLNGVAVQGNMAGFAGGMYNCHGSVTIKQTTFYSNTGSGSTGGAINNSGNNASLTIYDSQILSNTAGLGAAIYNSSETSGATVTISRTLISGNTATALGGGLRNSASSFMNVYASLIVGNVVSTTGSAGRGGGVANRGLFYAENTTFSGNIARDNLGTSQGGAILSEGNSTLTLRNVTISDNKANTAGSICTNGTTTGPCGSGSSTASSDLGNTIIANSRDSDTNALNNNCSVVAMVDEHGNLESTNSCLLAASTVNTNPLLGPLRFNGGPTRTYLPSPLSFAINNGTGLTGCPATDQRGFARPNTIQNPCDIGAVEVGPTLFLPLILR